MTDIQPRLIWNASPSLPLGLYRVEMVQPMRGEIAVIDPPEWVKLVAAPRGYLARTAVLMKRVVGVAGDDVCRLGSAILINGIRVAVAHWEDPQGQQLPLWRGCHRLSKGDLFLLSDADWSFDSRYFGPVAGKHLIGRAQPIWIVSN